MTTWDPANKAAGVTLSNGNLTASLSGASTQGVRSTNSRSSGVATFEMTSVSGVPAFGICTPNAPIATNISAAGVNYTVYSLSGTVRIWNSTVSADQAVTAGAIVVGDVWTVIIDIKNSRMYTRKNGANFVGDFVAGTGGLAIQAGNTWYVDFQGQNHSPDTCTVAFSSLANAPTGASEWDNAPPFIFPRNRNYVRR